VLDGISCFSSPHPRSAPTTVAQMLAKVVGAERAHWVVRSPDQALRRLEPPQSSISRGVLLGILRIQLGKCLLDRANQPAEHGRGGGATAPIEEEARAVPFRGDGYSLSSTSPSALTSVSASSSESKPKRQEQPGRGVCHPDTPRELPGSGGNGGIEAGCDCWAVSAAGVAGNIDSMPLRGIPRVSQGPLGSQWQTETANRQRFLLRAELRSAQVSFWAHRRTRFLCRDALRAALAERRE